MNGSLAVHNTTYALKQFHFHTPAEHRIDGYQYSMEMHFVFQAPSNATSVLSFLIDVEPSVATPVIDILAEAVSAIPTPGDETTIKDLDFSTFIKTIVEPATYYTMASSLTAPPCTEGVVWYISTKPVSLGVVQLKKLRSVLKFNARYMQNTLGSTNLLKVAAVHE